MELQNQKEDAMFAKAYEKAVKFTLPVIVSTINYEGRVECGCGAYTVLNKDGWILTSAHVVHSYTNYIQHREQMRKYTEALEDIRSRPGLDEKQRKKKISGLKSYPGWIVNHSFWWGRDGVVLKDISALKEGDIMIGRLEPFDGRNAIEYPVFKNPDRMRFATNLCKLGFPFSRIEAAYSEEKNRFEIKKGALPLPFFPIEGIYTRRLTAGKSGDGKYDITFLETSTPGLRGQSGGPIFDTEGMVWAVQSHTAHHPLGFSPKIVKNGKEVEEHQFLNTGVGAHGEMIVRFLRDKGVDFKMED